MEELFRFTVIRPPRSSTNVAVSIVSDASVLERLLRSATDPHAKRQRAREYRNQPNAVVFRLDELPLKRELDELADAFDDISGGDERAAVGTAIAQALGGRTLDDLTQPLELLRATFLSYVLAPDPNGPSLGAIARYLRTLQVALLYWNQAPALSVPGTVAQIMEAPILLPPTALWSMAQRPWPVGFADLLVVKQHIQRYEGGEIAHIENILRGEARKHSRKRSLSTERETTIEVERVEETIEERTTSERQKLSEEVQRLLKEHWNVKAGVDLGYGKEPSFFIRANVGFSYDRMSEESAKFASELAKDITTKASSRVTERVREVERRKIVETFEELEEQGFSNIGAQNVSGVYQFVDKVYRCRVYSYGKRWLLDFIVPEPAAFLLSARSQMMRGQTQSRVLKAPLLLTNNGNPDDHDTDPGNPLLPTSPMEELNSPFHYAKFVARYGVTGIEPPPESTVHVAKAFAVKREAGNQMIHAESLQIPDGYVVREAAGLGIWHGPSNSHVDVYVADIPMGFYEDDQDRRVGGPFYARLEIGSVAGDTLARVGANVPVSVVGSDATEIGFNLVFTCEVKDATIAAWRHQTYERIAARYEQLRKEYEDQLTAQGFLQQSDGRLGRSPDQNRLTERLEIKKFALAVLEGHSLTGVDQIDEASAGSVVDPRPAPDVANASFEDDLSRVRFLEQAFEWENMSYSLYPYFWGRSAGWRDSFSRVEDDPMFENFLRAGAARVVLAVRPGFADDVFYYLATGLVWSGADLPVIGDPRYVPIVDELRQQAGAGAPGEPYGDDWELRLPTDLVQLRPDDKLPVWQETDPGAQALEPRTWYWVEKR
jgi:hypothetical protein